MHLLLLAFYVSAASSQLHFLQGIQGLRPLRTLLPILSFRSPFLQRQPHFPACLVECSSLLDGMQVAWQPSLPACLVECSSILGGMQGVKGARAHVGKACKVAAARTSGSHLSRQHCLSPA